MATECLSSENFTKKLEDDRQLLPFINKVPLKNLYREINIEINNFYEKNQASERSCYVTSKIGADILTIKGFFCQKIIAFAENLEIKDKWANHQAIIIKVVDKRRHNRFITNYILDPLLDKDKPMPFNSWTVKLANLAFFDAKNDVLIYYEIFPHFFAKPKKFSFDIQFDTCRYTYFEKEINNTDSNSLLNPNSLIHAIGAK